MTIDWAGFKFPKRDKVKFTGVEYEKFKNRVFERDGWRCQNLSCGSRRNLTLHHKIKRSKVRLDTMENCITLCVKCHDKVEQHKLKVEGW